LNYTEPETIPLSLKLETEFVDVSKAGRLKYFTLYFNFTSLSGPFKHNDYCTYASPTLTLGRPHVAHRMYLGFSCCCQYK